MAIYAGLDYNDDDARRYDDGSVSLSVGAQPAPDTSGVSVTTNTDWNAVDDRGGVTGTTAPPPTTAPDTSWFTDPNTKLLTGAPSGFDANKWTDLTHTTPKYVAGRILANGGTIEMAAQAVGATVISPDKIRLPTGEIIDVYYAWKTGSPQVAWNQTGGTGWTDPSAAGAQSGAGSAGAYGGTGSGAPGTAGSAFSDPATAQWEQLIRSMTQRLNTPNPAYDEWEQLIRSMVDRLNTPVPDATRELQQTQALDPLQREADAQKQRAALRLSQRGITQGSGVFEQAMQDIDRQFAQIRTRTQGDFATRAATEEEGRRMQATNLFGQVPQMQAAEDARMLDAINLFQRIPNYQDTRLQLARSTLIPTDPTQLLGTQQNYQSMALQNQLQQMQLAQQQQQYANAQNNQFWQWLMQAVPGVVDAFQG